jgi:hypothetical protein
MGPAKNQDGLPDFDRNLLQKSNNKTLRTPSKGKRHRGTNTTKRTEMPAEKNVKIRATFAKPGYVNPYAEESENSSFPHPWSEEYVPKRKQVAPTEVPSAIKMLRLMN